MTNKAWAYSGTKWEEEFGYSRAIRQGDRILISGCAPIEPDGTAAIDVARQAERCFEIIADAIGELGGTMDDIVRTRIYLSDRADLDDVLAVHGQRVGKARPTCTAIVAALIRPEWKVEIEAEAICAAA